MTHGEPDAVEVARPVRRAGRENPPARKAGRASRPDPYNGDPSILETYISYLRRKVDSVEPKLIHTVRGVGYVMRVPRPSTGDPDS